MRAVVTGAAGFIGNRLVHAVAATGWSCVGIDSVTPYYDVALKRANLRGQAELPAYEFHERDLVTAEIDELLRGADVVFHLAGQPGVRDSWRAGFSDYARQNVLATQRVLEACLTAGVRRVVYSSSSSVYGDAGAYPVGEDVLPAPVSPYGVTKLAGEHLCLAYAANFAMPVAALRYFSVYGPGQRPDMATFRLIEAALTGGEFPLYGTGDQLRDYTYVDDVVAATMAAATASLAQSVVLNIGGGTSISLNELIAIVESETRSPIDVVRSGAKPGDVRQTGADTSRAEQVLNWKPNVSITDGVRAQVAAARARGRLGS